jgi:hypothetical protein
MSGPVAIGVTVVIATVYTGLEGKTKQGSMPQRYTYFNEILILICIKPYTSQVKISAYLAKIDSLDFEILPISRGTYIYIYI